MKNTKELRIVTAVVAAILLAFSSATVALSKSAQDGEIVLIVPSDQDPVGNPRGPVFNPFSAYLINNQVVLESSTSYGTVFVELTSTAGDNYSTVFDTSEGSIIIPISGFAGDYTLLLTDAFGAQFVGEFEI